MSKNLNQKQIEELAQFNLNVYHYFSKFFEGKEKKDYSEDLIDDKDYKKFLKQYAIKTKEFNKTTILTIIESIKNSEEVANSASYLLSMLSEWKVVRQHLSDEQVGIYSNQNEILKNKMVNYLADKELTLEDVKHFVIPEMVQILTGIAQDLKTKIENRIEAYHSLLEKNKLGRPANLKDVNDYFDLYTKYRTLKKASDKKEIKDDEKEEFEILKKEFEK